MCNLKNKKSKIDGYICSPTTGRWVKIGTETYKKLLHTYSIQFLEMYTNLKKNVSLLKWSIQQTIEISQQNAGLLKSLYVDPKLYNYSITQAIEKLNKGTINRSQLAVLYSQKHDKYYIAYSNNFLEKNLGNIGIPENIMKLAYRLDQTSPWSILRSVNFDAKIKLDKAKFSIISVPAKTSLEDLIGRLNNQNISSSIDYYIVNIGTGEGRKRYLLWKKNINMDAILSSFFNS